jgi:hypothetical protein
LAQVVHNRRDWQAGGSVRRRDKVLAAVGRAATALQRNHASFAQEKAVVTVARDIAQEAIVKAGGPSFGSSSSFADADHELLVGSPADAVKLLARATRKA